METAQDPVTRRHAHLQLSHNCHQTDAELSYWGGSGSSRKNVGAVMTQAITPLSEEQQRDELIRQVNLFFDFIAKLNQGDQTSLLFYIGRTLGHNRPYDALNKRTIQPDWQAANALRTDFANKLRAHQKWRDYKHNPRIERDVPTCDLLKLFIADVRAHFVKFPDKDVLARYRPEDGTIAPDEPPEKGPHDRDRPKPPSPREGGAEAELVTEETAPAPAVAGITPGKRVGVLTEAPTPDQSRDK